MARLYGADMDRVVAGVLAGGVVGATGRWAIGELGWPSSITLLVVNTIGSFVLGVVVARWGDREHPLRLALGVGLCGGFTTFSGVAVDIAARLDAGDVVEGLSVAVASVVLGAAAFLTGRRQVGVS